VLATNDLAIYILVVVFVKGGNTARVADPEVNGIRLCLEGDSCPGYVGFDICIQCCILFSEVVILCQSSS
jgi:hypothetical protein